MALATTHLNEIPRYYAILNNHTSTNMNARNDLNPTAALPLKDPSLFRMQSYINGEWVDADSGKRFEVDNPATGAIIARVSDCGAAETTRAIDAANGSMV